VEDSETLPEQEEEDQELSDIYNTLIQKADFPEEPSAEEGDSNLPEGENVPPEKG
jgi:hypothetical protein